MGIWVELRDETGRAVRGLPDPSGGTFDAAGDFDRFIDHPPYDQVAAGLPVLQSIDPYDDTYMPSGVMARLIADVVTALPLVNDGPERRGLLRLRVLAERCSRLPESSLVWIGD